jgi:raffinose/stachyose/melibiose transport system substrate-binding protein
MKKVKYFLFLIILVSMVLSACAGPAPQPTAPPPAQEQPAVTQAPAAQPASELTTDKVQLVFWSMWNESEPAAQVLQKLMDDFTAQHPNITFSVVWNGRENQTKLRTALTAGTKVDFMDQDSDQLAGGMMSEGLGYPLDEWLTQNALDESVPVKDVFSPGVLDQYKSAEGKTIEWPWITSPVMFWYNKDVFTKAGVTKPPETWDEFISACEKIKATGVAPIVTESNISEYDNYWFMYLIERQKGPDFLLKAIEDKTGEMWKDPAFSTAISMIKELWTKGCFPEVAKGYLWPAGQNILATDLAGMELSGAWLPNELKNSTRPDFKWGGLPFPSIPGGAGDRGDINLWTGSMMILKDSAHPREVFEFLKFLMTKENQSYMATEAIQGVTNKSVAWPEALVDGATAANNAHAVILSVGGGLAYHPEFVKSVINGNLNKAFFGTMTPDEFTAKMASDAAAYWQTHSK